MLLVSNKEVIFYGCLFECFYSDLRCANIFSSKSLIIEIDQNLFIIIFLQIMWLRGKLPLL